MSAILEIYRLYRLWIRYDSKYVWKILRHKDKRCKKENENITQPLNNIKRVPYVAVNDHIGHTLFIK